MNIEILGSAYSPTNTLQNELCLMKVKRYNCLKLKVNIALHVTCVFQSALLKNEILRLKPYFLRAYHICSVNFGTSNSMCNTA